ncbi:EAL domain-containing protein [Catenovulum sp. 2E275]|uniref:bifunctional diguanylate cyclase/phosphodiesterase n=1 Tax=Catenovulum sp. 2E275 TaxID=2980497 RepID=UPI0021D2A2A6|nr:EAL domain-containing protein [Catenovulum sp. 2E275]MCU4676069.1 EAL domain-containing protein [Catenovulum sp. 2E275]
MNSTGNDDIFLFAEENEEACLTSIDEYGWHILIVDDDKEIHTVTQLALSGVRILGKPLLFGHAYSGKDSVEYLKSHNDVAIVLMDVVMENDNAGLDAVKQIRDELHRDDTRIILRTGQPGYAPEEQVVQEYDINDYKTKTELTRNKLVTTLISALRSYKQICQIKQNHFYLEHIILASTSLQQQHQINQFAKLVIEHFCLLTQILPDGLLAIKNTLAEKTPIIVMGGSQKYQQYENQALELIDNDRIIRQVSLCINQKQNIISEQDTTLFINNQKYQAALYINATPNLAELGSYIEIYLANISIALDNITLIKELKITAFTDKLTGLQNRAGFIKSLNKFIEQPSLGDTVVLVDICHFSEVNHGLSQEIGNQLLKACADRLQDEYGESCQIARINADVFGIIGSADKVSPEKIEDTFSFPLLVANQRFPIYVNSGFYQRETTAQTGLQVLKYADIALNQAKQSHAPSFAYFDEAFEQKMAWRLGMVQQLRADFQAGRLQLWLQPQISLDTQKATGCEALLRWKTEQGNMISPDIFIPIAEHSGLINEIGDWVIEEACRHIKQLENRGIHNINISVNVSIAQFRDPTFISKLCNTIDLFNVSPEQFGLEITESILMDNPKVIIESLNTLKQHGINISLDDFGTGFSSLSYLNQLPITTMKVDRSFINEMDTTNGEVIVETILALGQKLNLITIAEGVETQEQINRLTELGCNIIQGYFYAKPMPFDEFQAYLSQQPS